VSFIRTVARKPMRHACSYCESVTLVETEHFLGKLVYHVTEYTSFIIIVL